MTLGQKIRELRERNQMLQRELASKLEVGDGYLSKIERDQKILKREHLKTLSVIFKCPLKELEALWIATKIYDIVKYEETGLEALRVAEEQINYNKTYAKIQ